MKSKRLYFPWFSGNSECGIITLDDLEKKCTKRTAEEISAVIKEKNSFNQALYERAKMIKKSSSDGFELRVPLRYLSRFFDLDMVWPGKHLLSIELKMNPPSKTLIKEETMTDSYDVQIKKD